MQPGESVHPYGDRGECPIVGNVCGKRIAPDVPDYGEMPLPEAIALKVEVEMEGSLMGPAASTAAEVRKGAAYLNSPGVPPSRYQPAIDATCRQCNVLATSIIGRVEG